MSDDTVNVDNICTGVNNLASPSKNPYPNSSNNAHTPCNHNSLYMGPGSCPPMLPHKFAEPMYSPSNPPPPLPYLMYSKPVHGDTVSHETNVASAYYHNGPRFVFGQPHTPWHSPAGEYTDSHTIKPPNVSEERCLDSDLSVTYSQFNVKPKTNLMNKFMQETYDNGSTGACSSKRTDIFCPF